MISSGDHRIRGSRDGLIRGVEQVGAPSPVVGSPEPVSLSSTTPGPQARGVVLERFPGTSRRDPPAVFVGLGGDAVGRFQALLLAVPQEPAVLSPSDLGGAW
ncbi:hypothetical protein GCM10027184_55030 [Saccharothrix stipae]